MSSIAPSSPPPAASTQQDYQFHRDKWDIVIRTLVRAHVQIGELAAETGDPIMDEITTTILAILETSLHDLADATGDAKMRAAAEIFGDALRGALN